MHPSLLLALLPPYCCCCQIADEFKVVVVEAIKALCLKFPQVSWSPDAAQRSAARRPEDPWQNGIQDLPLLLSHSWGG